MDSAQFKWARGQLGLSIDQLSEIIDVNQKTIRIWERGDRNPHPTAGRVMGWMLNGFRPDEFPETPRYPPTAEPGAAGG